MTRDDMHELAVRRQRFAQLRVRVSQGYVVLTAGLVGLVALTFRRDLDGGLFLNSLGCFLMATGALLLTRAGLADTKQPDRYGGGDLVVRRDPRHMREYMLAYLMQGCGCAVMASGVISSLGGGWLTGAVSAMCLLGGLVRAGPYVLQWFRPTPVLTVSREGLFAPDVMRRPMTWDELESIPAAPSAPPYLLALKTRDRDDNRPSFWARPLGTRATHLILGRAADTSQADILLAIANFRPSLIEALTFPLGQGLRAALSPARTI